MLCFKRWQLTSKSPSVSLRLSMEVLGKAVIEHRLSTIPKEKCPILGLVLQVHLIHHNINTFEQIQKKTHPSVALHPNWCSLCVKDSECQKSSTRLLYRDVFYPLFQKEKEDFVDIYVNGGRDGRLIGAYELAKAVEELGAGEILLNCIDCDGQGKGFDIDLVKLISDSVSIPVIASSGAGSSAHFTEVFRKTNASAALAAGIFHRKEVPIQFVKEHLLKEGIEVRI